MPNAYSPAETLALESWPSWKNALFGGIVFLFVVGVWIITSQVPNSAQLSQRNAVVICEDALRNLNAAPGAAAAQQNVMAAACQGLRDQYVSEWGEQP